MNLARWTLVKHRIYLGLLVILVAAIPAAAQSQSAGAVLAGVAKALAADKVRAVHYSGSGSSYVAPQGSADTGWSHRVMKSYVRDLNLHATTSRLQLVRAEGTGSAEQTVSHVVDSNSPWSSQYEFWITPFGFLKGAMAHNASVEAKTVYGTPYKVVTFTLPGNHKVVGYINDKDMIERIETWIGDKGDTLVEAHYREYAEFNGVKVPTMITQKQGGQLSLIVIVKDVKVEV